LLTTQLFQLRFRDTYRRAVFQGFGAAADEPLADADALAHFHPALRAGPAVHGPGPGDPLGFSVPAHALHRLEYDEAALRRANRLLRNDRSARVGLDRQPGRGQVCSAELRVQSAPAS